MVTVFCCIFTHNLARKDVDIRCGRKNLRLATAQVDPPEVHLAAPHPRQPPKQRAHPHARFPGAA